MRYLAMAILMSIQNFCWADELGNAITKWRNQMIQFGESNCDFLTGPADDAKLNATYYDAQRVFFQIYDFTSDSKWLNCAEKAERVYRDYYLRPNEGKLPGYMIFTKGLASDYQRFQDFNSKIAVGLLSTNGMYCDQDGYNNGYLSSSDKELPDPHFARENAYCMSAYIDSKAIGQSLPGRVVRLRDNALLHFERWFVKKDATYIKPFMVGLEAEALIRYYNEVDRDPRIPTALQKAADELWNEFWDAPTKSMKYILPANPSEPSTPSPDLNMLILPIYQFVYERTGLISYRDKADQLFIGGVNGAWLQGEKQFNQNYRSSFSFVASRMEATPTPTPVATPTKTATPSPTPKLTMKYLKTLIDDHEARIKRIEG